MEEGTSKVLFKSSQGPLITMNPGISHANAAPKTPQFMQTPSQIRHRGR